MMAEALGVSAGALASWDRRREERSDPRVARGRPPVVPAGARKRIRSCYRAHFGQWGPRVLSLWCQREGLGQWSAGTLAGVIADLRPAAVAEPPPVRHEMTAANVMWSEDGTGFRQQGRKQELLVVQDEHSRLKLNWRLVAGPAKEEDVYKYLEQAFDFYGPPLVLKHDGASIFHGERIENLLDKYQVVALTGPGGYPQYNGKQERSMRDIKSYERAMRRHGVGGSLIDRLDVTMHDLNEERPRPVLDGRTAQETYDLGQRRLPDRYEFHEEVRLTERRIRGQATSRSELDSARRRAVEQVLIRHGLMEFVGDVSHDLSSDGATE